MIHKLLLDHKGSQVGSVAGQEDHSEKGPYGHDKFTGSAPGVLYWDRVVEHQTPQQPDSLTNSEGGPMRVYINARQERGKVSKKELGVSGKS